MQLALGLVGGYFFGPIGYLIGSTLGGLFERSRTQTPQPIKAQSAAYGQMIPHTFGQWRTAAWVCWQTDLIPHTSGGGGKGFGSSSSAQQTTWTVSFAAKFEKGPKRALRRVYFDSQLVYSAVAGEGPFPTLPMAVYLGSETASPDPTMEAAIGVGHVPAFRDDCAIVFTDLDVTAYGGRVPNINAEFVDAVGDIPIRISTFSPLGSFSSSALSGVVFADNVITCNFYSTAAGSWTWHRRSFLLDGTPTGTDADAGLDHFWTISGTCMNADVAFGSYDDGVGTEYNSWIINGNPAVRDVVNAMGGGFQDAGFGSQMVSGNYLYTTCRGPGGATYGIAQYAFNTATQVPSAAALAGYSFGALSGTNPVFISSDDGFVWVTVPNATAGNNDLYKFNPDLTLAHHWAPTDLPANFRFFFSAAVWNGLFLFNYTPGGGPTAIVYAINGTTFDPVAVGSLLQGTTPEFPLAGGLFLGRDGVISLNPASVPVTLQSIVDKISDLCGQSARDTSQLQDLVPGYAILQQASGRDSIAALMPVYFFDPVESGTVVKFVKRGAAPAVTIPDDDLAAQVSGTTPPPLITVKRRDELELPQSLYFTYASFDAAFQNGTQLEQRQVTRSELSVSTQVAIALTDATAKQVVATQLYNAWTEQQDYVINVPRKYAYLEPTDVIVAHGLEMRAGKENWTTGGVISLECLASHQSLWAGGFVPGKSLGISTTATSSGSSQTTTLAFLDIPLATDADTEQGVYAALYGTDASWPGGALFKSADGGNTYGNIGTLITPSVVGLAPSALPDFAGGNVFDESSSLSVTINAGATLASATYDAILNGANMALVGNELLQFRDATLTGANTYTLRGFLRGRRGTEWAIPGHNTGETFVLLASCIRVSAPNAEVGQARLYKAVTSGGSLAAAAALSFTNSGNALKCYAPVQLGGATITPFDGTVQINWTRRTRIGGVWANLVDVPLSEASEQYVVQIWDAAYAKCARVITTTSSTVTYTAAQQTTDFGATQQTIFFTVGQIGAIGLGNQAIGSVPGSGASNTAPSSPVTPYGYAPPSGGSGGCTLPTTTTVITANGRYFNYTLGPASEWVIQFTTPNHDGGGSLSCVEAGGGFPTGRHAVLSATPCGAPLIPAAVQDGMTVTQRFYTGSGNPNPTAYPTLQRNTTYYWNVTELQDSPVSVDFAQS